MKKLVDWKALRTMVPYSRQHLKRLEDAGQFPLRANLGKHRVAWDLAEVQTWIEERLANR